MLIKYIELPIWAKLVDLAKQVQREREHLEGIYQDEIPVEYSACLSNILTGNSSMAKLTISAFVLSDLILSEVAKEKPLTEDEPIGNN
jgi:hypothetical protein